MKNKDPRLEIAEHMYRWDKKAEHVFMNSDSGDLVVIKEDNLCGYFIFRTEKNGGTRTTPIGHNVLQMLQENVIKPLVYLGKL